MRKLNFFIRIQVLIKFQPMASPNAFNTLTRIEENKLSPLDKKRRDATIALTFYMTCVLTEENAEIVFGHCWPCDYMLYLLEHIERLCIDSFHAIEHAIDIDYFDWARVHIEVYVPAAAVHLVQDYAQENVDELIEERRFLFQNIRAIRWDRRVESGLL